jgi:hypothetical protein
MIFVRMEKNSHLLSLLKFGNNTHKKKKEKREKSFDLDFVNLGGWF